MGNPKGNHKRKIVEDDYANIENYATVGLTNDQMSYLLGMSPATFDRRIKDNPKVAEALHKGRAKAIFAVGVSAYQQAVSGNTPAMTMFYLKCRAGWKETQVTEVTGKDGESLFTSFTDMVKKVASGEE